MLPTARPTEPSLGDVPTALIVLGVILLLLTAAAVVWYYKLNIFTLWSQSQQKDETETEMWKHVDSEMDLYSKYDEEEEEEEEEEDRKYSSDIMLCKFQVVATENMNPVALQANIDCALATEKLDGTCCYVTVYKGRPHLWARLDRKPNKQAEKRFKKYQYSNSSCKGFTWNVEEDFKTVPEMWIPAHGVKHLNECLVPDEHGHIPGWVPVETDNKQYCWHSSVVDYEVRAALVLRPSAATDADEDTLEIAAVPLAELLEQTLELIGTNVNGNPYGLGSKKQPVHCLVSHGTIRIRNPPPVNFQQLCSWFSESPEGRVEGIVWHCNDGTLIKITLYCFLTVTNTFLFRLKKKDFCWITVKGSICSVAALSAGSSSSPRNELAQRRNSPWRQAGDRSRRRDGPINEYDNSKDLFASFSRLNGRRFSRLQDVRFDL
ncbi:hypothetical protein L3Q82_023651 [Scortum barcoo]|uniref:Uncharacterized protein n=1 Tax=Scortum barcoo TaxID=214431 RepID=A0ACB8WUM5_9TELE|nr:hypothetical protein L3Q82_023651 [Scortum barcoo]